MKRTISITCALMIILGMTTSCTLQKRQYSSGYYVNWQRYKHKPTIAKENKWEPLAIRETRTNPLAGPEVKMSLVAMVASQKSDKVSRKAIYVSPVSHNKTAYIPKANFITKAFMIEPPKTQGKAIAALVLGILSLVTYYGALVFAILAIILGRQAIKKINAEPEKYKGKGMAKAGMIMGIIGCILLAIIIISVA